MTELGDRKPPHAPRNNATLSAMNDGEPVRSPWLTRDEVCARLRVKKSTVESWAVEGKGPRFAKFGKHVRYRLSDVEAWEEQQFVWSDRAPD